MKHFWIIGMSILLIFSPVPIQAQAAQSVPSTGQITDAGLLVAGGAIAVAVVTGIFALLTKYVDYKFAAAEKKREAAEAAAKAERDEEAAKAKAARDTEAVQRADQTKLIEAISTLGEGMSAQAAAAAQDRAAASADRKTLLEIVETKDSAQEGRKNGIAEVKKNTEELVEPVLKSADDTLASVKNIETKVAQLMTKAEFAEQLRPVRDDISALRRTIEERLLPILAPALTPPPSIVITNNGAQPPSDFVKPIEGEK